MGLVFNRRALPAQKRYFGIGSPLDLVPLRTNTLGRSTPYISHDTALKNSAVWAAIRIRADLISTLPVSAFRDVNLGGPDTQQIDAPLSPFMTGIKFMQWRYSSQVELDRSGNSIGIITDVDGQGRPANIDLHATSEVVLVSKNGKIKYRIGNVEYEPEVIWHEMQYTVSGLPVGLSPVQYAALTLGQYQSVQEFATEWFVSSATPRSRLKNVEKRLNQKEATVVKEAWRASQTTGEPFVHGADWEYSLIQGEQSAANWIDSQKLGLEDAARFFNVPADLIDAAMGGSNITYANVVQRNLQFLIMHLGPTIVRRETAWSELLPRPRYVELDSKALLRMDPETRANWIRTQIEARVLTPNEARAMDNRLPLTDEQVQEFNRLGLNRRGSTPATSLAPVPVDPSNVDAESDLSALPAAPTSTQGNPDNAQN